MFGSLFGKSSGGKGAENYGISLRHLSSLPIGENEPFNAACDYVKEKTKNLPKKAYRSYACYLMNDKATKHLVKKKAEVFVSYAWSGGFAKTMNALKSKLLKNDKDDVFVWMDFAIVDQHAAANTNIDFKQWTKTFRGNLVKIGKAILVLTPMEKPIAIGRSWCCFEWVTIVDSKIPFEYCVNPGDEEAMIIKMKKGMSQSDFSDIFAAINVEKAAAFKPSDQDSILALMREIGIVKVNEVVMKSLKGWLLGVVSKAKEQTVDGTQERCEVLSVGGGLNSILVRLLSYNGM
jgi:hypothetical protein